MVNSSSPRRWCLMGALVLAWLVVASIVVQVFLAGLALFDNGLRWKDHQNFGHMIGILVVPLFLLVALGRLPRSLVGMTGFLLIVYLVQISLPNVSAGYIAAIHPLVGFFLLGMSIDLGNRLRSLASPRPATGTAPSPDPPQGR